MASNFYSKIVPDYRDLDNQTGERPALLVEIVENDGGVGLLIHDDHLGSGKASAIFFNVEEAEDFATSLREAIERAEPKNAHHENRVREPHIPKPITMTVKREGKEPETFTI